MSEIGESGRLRLPTLPAPERLRGHGIHVLAGVLVMSTTALGMTQGPLSPAALLALGCLTALSVLAGWRRYPVVDAAVGGLLLVIPMLTADGRAMAQGSASIPAAVAVMVIAYTLGERVPWRRSLAGLIPLTAGSVLVGGGVNPFQIMVTVGPWLVGLTIAGRRHAAVQLERRAAELAQERELFAQESVRYDRTRIARELHDLVAHGVSLMVVQANAGARLAAVDATAAAESFDSIIDTVRRVETEVAQLFDLLAPRPGPAAPFDAGVIRALITRASGSDLQITLSVDGELSGLSALAADAAHHVVEEALTNAIKHAPGATVQVVLTGGRDQMDVVIRNGTARRPAYPLNIPGGHHGLSGLRERVRLAGGTFESGLCPDGGWLVKAVLPQCSNSFRAVRGAPSHDGRALA